MKGLERLIRELLTGDDNATWDTFRLLAVVSILVGIGLSIAAVWKGQPFDMQQFGIGVGALLAGVGAALRLDK